MRGVSGRFSHRTRRRRNSFSDAKERSSTQRHRTSPPPCFVSRIACRGKIWRLRPDERKLRSVINGYLLFAAARDALNKHVCLNSSWFLAYEC
jgi:hypothetical protein